MDIAKLECEDTPEGVKFRVKARAGASNNGLGGLHDGALRVRVTTAPEKGKANKSIIGVLAKALAISKSSIEIVAGETDSRKTLLIKGLKSTALRDKLKSQIS
ncbi:MAG: DUF167 domain-containing protein [Planctomycetes bacterium]|nr:DUF167 domain-containing protein [Planctomycetota bacterium]